MSRSVRRVSARWPAKGISPQSCLTISLAASLTEPSGAQQAGRECSPVGERVWCNPPKWRTSVEGFLPARFPSLPHSSRVSAADHSGANRLLRRPAVRACLRVQSHLNRPSGNYPSQNPLVIYPRQSRLRRHVCIRLKLRQALRLWEALRRRKRR